MKMNDQELLQQIRDNDSESAFKALFEGNYDRMFRIAVYFLQNDDWAKEVVLDVLASLWENRKTAIIPNDFHHYSFVLIKNASLNLLKKEQRTIEETPEEDGTPDPQTLLEESELFETYERLLAELPDRCREAFCLVKEEGKSYAQVAEEMNISVKTVDAQLQKALQFLRTNLAKYLNRDYGKRFFSIFL